MDEEIPTIHNINGQYVLDDPSALTMMRAVNKQHCRKSLEDHLERMQDFVIKMKSPRISSDETCIVLINVDDINGKDVAEALMPDHNWQSIRDQGQVPYARGLVDRRGMGSVLDVIDVSSAKKLREQSGTAIVVIDHGSTEIFSPKDLTLSSSK